MDRQELLKQQMELFDQTVDNFEKMLEHGQIDEDEFNSLKASAYMELQERIAEIMDVQEEDIDGLVDEESDEEYSDDSETANFSTDSYYGSALLELAKQSDYDDIEQYCIDLAEATGYDANDVYGIITGEIEPDDEFTLSVSNVFELDEELEAQLLLAGMEARGENIEELLAEEDDSETEDEDSDEEYSLRNELAEFKMQSLIKDELSELENRCFSLVEEGKMPPYVAEILLGNHKEKDKIAAFSSLCNKNSVAPETQLFALNTVLKVFEHMPQIQFGYYAEQNKTTEELDEEKDMRGIATNWVKEYNKNKPAK